MIKGIISLFKSGMILNPMILGGICTGIFILKRKGLQLFYSQILVDVNFYLICTAVAFVYTFALKPIYKGYGKGIDIAATFRRSIGYAFILLLTICLTTVFFGTLFF